MPADPIALGSAASATVFTITTTATAPAGSTIVVAVRSDAANGVTDDAGNTYHMIGASTGGTGQLYYAYNVTQLTSGAKIHFGAGASFLDAYAFYLPTATTTDPFDQSVTATGSGTTPSSGSTSATTQAAEVSIGFVSCYNTTNSTQTMTSPTGYTPIGVAQYFDVNNGVQFQAYLFYKVLAATGTQNGTQGTLSVSATSWRAWTATFKVTTVVNGTATLDSMALSIAPQALAASGAANASLGSMALTITPKTPAASGAATAPLGLMPIVLTFFPPTFPNANVMLGSMNLSITPYAVAPSGASSVILGSMALSIMPSTLAATGSSTAALGTLALTIAMQSLLASVLLPVPIPTITGNLAVGRRLPEFKLLLYDPLTSPALTRQSTRIDLSPDIESLSFSTQPDGGFTALTVGYDKFIKFPNGEERHFGRLQQPAILRDFAHVALIEGKRVVWEGRALLPDLPGGRLQSFQAKGYGYTGLTDNPYLNTNTAQQTSGQIFREAIASCAPTLTLGGPSKYVDPGVYHPYNSFNYQYPAQILQQILTDGDTQGNQLTFTVYENRLVSLLPQTAPNRPTYIIDFTDEVDWQRNLDGCVGAVFYQYSGGSQPAVYVECPQSLATWIDQHHGLKRIGSVNGGTLTDAEALAKATTWIAQNCNPAVAGTFTIGGRFFGDVQGLRLASGGTRAPWLVRAGETVQVGDQGTYFIAATQLDCNTLMLSVSLGTRAFNQDKMLTRLRTVAGHVVSNTNPNSGAAA